MAEPVHVSAHLTVQGRLYLNAIMKVREMTVIFSEAVKTGLVDEEERAFFATILMDFGEVLLNLGSYMDNFQCWKYSH